VISRVRELPEEGIVDDMVKVAVLIIGHGHLAEALLSSAEMIVGKQEMVATLGLEEGEGLSGFIEKVRGAIAELRSDEGILVLVDLFGGTPFNATVGAMQSGVHIVAGANLPMLLELLLSREQGSVGDLAQLALQAGQQGLRYIEGS